MTAIEKQTIMTWLTPIKISLLASLIVNPSYLPANLFNLPLGKNKKFWGFDSFKGIQLAGKKAAAAL